ncbi:MAG: M24 family metallopeptidase [Acidobacteria bacterium]|nr:M24 family metallopeptidase [Acidobacteriota bacterium]
MPKSAAAERAAKAAGRATEDLTKPIAGLRMIKSDREIELIRRSTDASVDAHLAAWRRTAAGLYEYQVAATMTQVYLEQGCERSAYSPIVAAGPNAVILHYALNRRRMDRGELLLMDVGAECTGYAADLTRTIPVSGRFTPRQREVYEVVIGAQEAAIQAAKPGMKLLGTGEDSLNGIALKYVNAHGLEKFYLHSLGHHVGLDVHDLTDPALELKPGMVITIEPGVYIAEEQIGVRIEDMVLITKNGAEVLSRRLPRKPADIEKAMRRK